ncbi:MAG: response regulator [Alphaproteobacteria bacterium]|nr:response regulator [Alphaproteobacteria bacterium]
MRVLPRILIVDDQESMRLLVKSLLAQLGFLDVALATDGKDALAVLKREPIDLVLLDGEMPVLDGIGTLKAIRTDAIMARLPVIMVTGRSDTGFVKELSGLGLNGYLKKPFSSTALAQRLSAIFPNHR